MSRRNRVAILVPLAVVSAGAAYYLFRPGATVPQPCEHVRRLPQIDPDYQGCTIPPNIAPLSFLIEEPGIAYRVHVHSGQDEGFVVSSRTPGIVFPAKKWRSLLRSHCGGALYFDVFVQDEQRQWRRFDRLVNRIAREEIDSYLVYRRLRPVHNIYTNMGTYQRDVSTYRESPVLLSGRDSLRCVNCHTFVNNNPDTMCLHIRGTKAGAAMIVARDGRATKIDTRTGFNRAPAAYTAWHPSGKLAVFASIEVVQFHHSVGDSRDVFVHNSDLGVYFVDSTDVRSTPPIADPDRLETFPAWSPDGKLLYFCSAARLWRAGLKARSMLPLNFREARYDLMRISYDQTTRTWGKRETVLLAKDIGLSINEPRISPDGRFLLFCTAEYGCFAVFQRSSDLHMMDLETGRHWPLEINSDRSDSWHCWSTNSRWIAFASKRRDGLFGRVYFSYIHPDGKAEKPVLLPQADPAFHRTFLENFNAPELITGPVRVPEKELLRAVESSDPRVATFAGMLSPSDQASATEKLREPPASAPRKTSVDFGEANRFYRLGLALEEEGRVEEAVEHYRLSVERLPKLHPVNIPVAGRLAWLYATHPSDRIRDGREALVLAVRAHKNAVVLAERGRDAQMRQRAESDLASLLDTQAAAYAECGGFARAVSTALEAERMALRYGQIELAVKIRERNRLYLLNKPYRATDSD